MPGAARLDYDGCAADTTKVDALVVTNAHGTVVGQLLGDGVGIEATKGSFQDAYLCLDLRTDVNVHSDLFSTKAVARYAEGAFDILDAALASDSTNAKYCVTVYETGTFFPVLVASDVDAACSADCAGDGGVCLGDSCACFCGFSGSTCAAGCKNDCSGAGACDEDTNACACDAGRSGDDCGTVDCPTGGDGTRCSLRGTCQKDATCACDAGYEGDACEYLVVAAVDPNVTLAFGYSESTAVDDAVFDGVLETPKPTPRPTLPSLGNLVSVDEVVDDDACVDSTTWYYKKAKKNCDYVAEDPDDRCSEKDDFKVKAKDACPVACDTCETECADSTT